MEVAKINAHTRRITHGIGITLCVCMYYTLCRISEYNNIVNTMCSIYVYCFPTANNG